MLPIGTPIFGPNGSQSARVLANIQGPVSDHGSLDGISKPISVSHEVSSRTCTRECGWVVKAEMHVSPAATVAAVHAETDLPTPLVQRVNWSMADWAHAQSADHDLATL